jgi:hypothetical protein
MVETLAVLAITLVSILAAFYWVLPWLIVQFINRLVKNTERYGYRGSKRPRQ